jgi:hypothetical protein
MMMVVPSICAHTKTAANGITEPVFKKTHMCRLIFEESISPSKVGCQRNLSDFESNVWQHFMFALFAMLVLMEAESMQVIVYSMKANKNIHGTSQNTWLDLPKNSVASNIAHLILILQK